MIMDGNKFDVGNISLLSVMHCTNGKNKKITKITNNNSTVQLKMVQTLFRIRMSQHKNKNKKKTAEETHSIALHRNNTVFMTHFLSLSFSRSFTLFVAIFL